MNNYRSILKKEWQILLVLAIYSIISIVLINHYQYIINSDGISYISIAQEYLNGDFADAINGYWGPLFSWLLIPFVSFSSTPVYTLYLTKILSIILGFFTIIGVRLLIYRFEMEKPVKTAILFSLIPVVLYFSFNLISPDLLVTCLLIYYFYIIFNPNYSNNLYNGILCGLIGALAYLSKSYAFIFFLAHFILFNSFYYFKSLTKDKKVKILKNFLLGLIIFFTISGIWIGLISAKYGETTIGTTGEYNYALVGPESQGDPLYYQGLLKPPNAHAINAWEDPSYFKMNSWSPFSSFSYFKYQLKLVLENIITILNIAEAFSILSIIIIIGSILLIIKSVHTSASKEKISHLLITIVIYAAGYSFILVESRYLWPIYILLIIMGGYLLNLLFKKDKFSNSLKKILLIFLVVSFVISPVMVLVTGYEINKDVYQLGNTLKTDYQLHGNIASNSKWELTSYLAYYTESKYYGQTKKNTNYNDLKKELEYNNIDYYIVWGNSKENVYLSHNFKEVTNGDIHYLKIYSLKN